MHKDIRDAHPGVTMATAADRKKHRADPPPEGHSMTPAERKANERARNTAAGLKRMELWAYPETHQAIKDAAAKITRDAAKRRLKAKQ